MDVEGVKGASSPVHQQLLGSGGEPVMGPPSTRATAPRRSRSRSTGRGVATGLLLELASILMLLAGLAHTTTVVAGTPQATADSLLSVATSPDAQAAVATKLVNQLQKDVTGPSQVILARDHARFVRAIEGAIAEPSLQGLARTDFVSIYDAIIKGRAARIDLRPLLDRLSATLHRVDPRIPAHPLGLRNAVVTTKPGRVSLRFLKWLVPAEVILAGLSVLVAMLTTALLVARPRRQFWSLGFALGNPAMALGIVGLLLPRVVDAISISDPEMKIIADQGGRYLGTAFLDSAAFFAAVMVLGLGAWALGRSLRGWRQARRA